VATHQEIGSQLWAGGIRRIKFFCPYLKIFEGVEKDIIYQNMYSKSVKIAYRYFRRLRLAKKKQKLVYFTSNANKMTLNQIFFSFL
jgi:hypothetical protein